MSWFTSSGSSDARHAADFFFRDAGLRGQLVDGVRPQSLPEILGADRFIVAVPDPRIGLLAKAAGLQLLQQAAQTSTRTRSTATVLQHHQDQRQPR